MGNSNGTEEESHLHRGTILNKGNMGNSKGTEEDSHLQRGNYTE